MKKEFLQALTALEWFPSPSSMEYKSFKKQLYSMLDSNKAKIKSKPKSKPKSTTSKRATSENEQGRNLTAKREVKLVKRKTPATPPPTTKASSRKKSDDYRRLRRKSD